MSEKNKVEENKDIQKEDFSQKKIRLWNLYHPSYLRWIQSIDELNQIEEIFSNLDNAKYEKIVPTNLSAKVKENFSNYFHANLPKIRNTLKDKDNDSKGTKDNKELKRKSLRKLKILLNMKKAVLNLSKINLDKIIS